MDGHSSGVDAREGRGVNVDREEVGVIKSVLMRI